MKKLLSTTFIFLLLSFLGSGFLADVASTSDEDEFFTIVLLPDTQIYSRWHPQHYYNQTGWIKSHKDQLNIKFVIHLGDITNFSCGGESSYSSPDCRDAWYGVANEWNVAVKAHKTLDSAKIPYSVIPGNHDYDEYDIKNKEGKRKLYNRELSKFNEHFPPSKFKNFDGIDHISLNLYPNENGNENNIMFFDHEFNNDTLEFMIVSLEYLPRKDAVCWAESVIQKNPDKRVIVVTHSYMSESGVLTTGDRQNHVIGLGGQHLWDEIIKRHSNIFMVLCGHISGSICKEDKGRANNNIYQILTDYTGETHESSRHGKKKHGKGFLKFIKFYPGYSTFYTEEFSASEFEFLKDTIEYPQEGKTPPDYEIGDSTYTSKGYQYDMTEILDTNDYLYSVDNYSFSDRTVNSIGTGQQYQPSISMDGDGKFFVAWEDGITKIRGFDKGGCECMPDIEIEGISCHKDGDQKDPVIAVSPSGGFVVVWLDDCNDGDDKYELAASAFDNNYNQGPIHKLGLVGRQFSHDIAFLKDGTLIVCWEDEEGGSYHNIFAKGFSIDGNIITESESIKKFQVNTNEDRNQQDPSIAASPDPNDGGFVIAWDDNRNVYARGFTENLENKWSNQPIDTINDDIEGYQINSDIAFIDNDYFAVVWEDERSGEYEIYGAKYDFNVGKRKGPDFLVNNKSAGQKRNPSIASRPNGSFVVTWQDDRPNNPGEDPNDFYQIKMALFNSDIAKDRNTDITVNLNGPGQQKYPVVATDKSGYFVIAWQDDCDKNEYYQILAKGYDINSIVDIRDNTDPEFTTCQADIEILEDYDIRINTGERGAIVHYDMPTAKDDITTNVKLELTKGFESGSIFPVGETIVMYTAIDKAGNSSSCSFTITVVDNEPPEITCPEDVEITEDYEIRKDGGERGAIVNYVVTASDNDSENVSLELTEGFESGSIFPIGTTTVTYTATDGSENTSSCSFEVTVNIITGVDDESLSADGLLQNYPNPFNANTIIEYRLLVTSHVELSIHDLNGKKVTTLVSETKAAGDYKLEWDTRGLKSATYLCVFTTDQGFRQTKKLVVE